MKGQYSEKEFYEMFDNATKKNISLNNGIAWIQHSKTINYYVRHSDNSWTNYHCRTKD